MKDRSIACVALVISIVALGYSAWVQSRADAMADAALHRREQQFVTTMAPKIQRIQVGLGLKPIENPKTLEDLFGPYLNSIHEAGSGDSPDNAANR